MNSLDISMAETFINAPTTKYSCFPSFGYYRIKKLPEY